MKLRSDLVFARYSISFPLYLWGIETWCCANGWLRCLLSFHFTYEELKQFFSLALQNLQGFVSTLPMRNWNMEALKSLFISGRVSTLPMRNWNTNYKNFKYFSCFCFHFTYEELKLSSKSKAWKSEKFPLYLWGIETISRRLYALLEQEVSTLPMRNWNHFNVVVCTFRTGSFHFTYEELKHTWHNGCCNNGWNGFHFTYEELKPFLYVFEYANIVCFHFTYEELKRMQKQKNCL